MPMLEGTHRAPGLQFAVVVSRYNDFVTERLLAGAREGLATAGVTDDDVTVLRVPGAYEIPLAAQRAAETGRFAGVIALGCLIRGATPHFDYIASEAASGLQLAALETGVPVAFGVLTVESIDQAEARVEKGAEAVRTALEMADAFAQLRASAATA